MKDRTLDIVTQTTCSMMTAISTMDIILDHLEDEADTYRRTDNGNAFAYNEIPKFLESLRYLKLEVYNGCSAIIDATNVDIAEEIIQEKLLARGPNPD